MDEALRAFLVESAENLARLEEDLVVLERTPSDADVLASVFRSVHTIKGTCGFFGFNRVELLTHAAEDALAKLRDGKLQLSRELTSALFELIDVVRHMLSLIEESGADGDTDYPDLIATFKKLQDQDGDGQPVFEQLAPVFNDSEKTSQAVESAIRVDVGLLDKLMNVVGELVLARNQILQYANQQLDPILSGASQRLNLIATELQEGVMKTRMQPISTVWSTFPRLMRDLELQTGKKVKLEREGGETELDRTLLQAIKDPLTHLVRNAVDHGLESPEQRLAAGKPEQGSVRLRAYHESGYVIIEISDDGAGVDAAAVLDKALKKNLIRQDQLATLAERDVLELLFLPGFSTAAQVTNISGRGVGLDVVRNNVERVGGSVDIQTSKGLGTSFKVKIPLTLAIIPALVTTCHDERYAIPQVNLLEIVRLDGNELRQKIEPVHSSLVYRLRGKLLPLVDLRQMLGLPERTPDAAVHILVLQADNREFGLLVDAVRDTEEIVVKPLGRHLKAVSAFAGATIMGDGRVALILDVVAIAQTAHVLTESQQSLHWRRSQEEQHEKQRRGRSLLLFRTGNNGFGAIPLLRVQRLEEFTISDIEYSCGREVVQYRNQILPLVRLSKVLGNHHFIAEDKAGLLQVIVHGSEQGLVGLVVDHIVDIVADEATAFTRQENGGPVLGTAVVQGRVTDMIDLDRIMVLSQQLLLKEQALATAEESSNDH